MKKTYNFFTTEAGAGLLLFATAILSFSLANSQFSSFYFDFINYKINLNFGDFNFVKSIQYLVNDGLMALFFFFVGLEIKKELTQGSLKTPAKAFFPLAAGIGGMLIPALIYTAFNYGTDFSNGWGVPMATDIAFALGVLGIFGKGLPSAVRIFLLSLAIVDDVGAVLVLAIFYSNSINIAALALGLASIFVYRFSTPAINKKAWFAAPIAIFAWFLFFNSGVHATIAGVLMGLVHRPSVSLKTSLQKINPYICLMVLPIFAFYNSGISMKTFDTNALLSSSIFNGIFWGLLAGKVIGILLFSYLCNYFKIGQKDKDLTWLNVLAVAFLAGIGFTMSIFISNLAFDDVNASNISKISVLITSTVAMICSVVFLTFSKKAHSKKLLSLKS